MNSKENVTVPYFEKIKIFLFVITYIINCESMSEKFLEQMEKIKNKVENMNEKDILNLLNKAFIFNEKPRIILYTKNKNKIAGYLEIDNKLLNFEIWFSVMSIDINVTIGKVSKIIKE